jgi:hypothetical protein
MKVYSEQEKFSNYKFLVRSIHELKAGRDITEADVEYFKLIRYYCKDFNYANTDVEHSKFRRKANETEQMSRYLHLYLTENRTLDKSTYIQLLERINFMFEFLMPAEEIAAALMSKIRL